MRHERIYHWVAETVPIKHEGVERAMRTLVFAVPPAALIVEGWLAWGGALHWQDLVGTR